MCTRDVIAQWKTLKLHLDPNCHCKIHSWGHIRAQYQKCSVLTIGAIARGRKKSSNLGYKSRNSVRRRRSRNGSETQFIKITTIAPPCTWECLLTLLLLAAHGQTLSREAPTLILFPVYEPCHCISTVCLCAPLRSHWSL